MCGIDIYWHRITDDGADWRCKECNRYLSASKVVRYVINGEGCILCFACLDESLAPGWRIRVEEREAK